MMAALPEQLAARRAAMLALVPVGVVLLDARARVVEANPSAQRVLGLREPPWSLTELHGRVADPTTGALLADADLPWRQALAGRLVEDMHVLIRASDEHSAVWSVAITARPFNNLGGLATGVILIAAERGRCV
jgi:PAS domain-containing protein